MSVSTKEQASKIQDLLTLCLAKAYDTALSACDGADWFLTFKEEEKQEEFPITRETQFSIGDCDFQALMKILYYRSVYATKILTYYGKANLIPEGVSGQTPFKKTIGRLINDYRNNIAAHASADKIRSSINKNGENISYDYSDAIQDMIRVARVFSAVVDERNCPYLKQIEKEANAKSKTGLIIGIIAVIVAVAALLVIFFHPWEKRQDSSEIIQKIEETETLAIDDMTDYEMNDSRAAIIANEFIDRLSNTVNSGDKEGFTELLDQTGFSDSDIDVLWDDYGVKFLPDKMKDIRIKPFIFNDYSMIAYLYLADDRYGRDDVLVLNRFEDGWKISAFANKDLVAVYENKLDDLFGDASGRGYCNSFDYQVAFSEPLQQGVYLRVKSMYMDQGSVILELVIFNGMKSDIEKPVIRGLTIESSLGTLLSTEQDLSLFDNEKVGTLSAQQIADLSEEDQAALTMNVKSKESKVVRLVITPDTEDVFIEDNLSKGDIDLSDEELFLRLGKRTEIEYEIK